MNERTIVPMIVGAWMTVAGCGEEPGTGMADGGDTQGSDAGSNDAGAEAGEAGDSGSGLQPQIPAVGGPCPTFAAGDLTFSPPGIEPRMARVWMDPAAFDGGGRLQFYFHGTGGSPDEATWAYGNDWIAAAVADGAIVVAPFNDPATGQFPWWSTNGDDRPDDFLVMDEIVACAVQDVGIDPRRIHLAGFSAGGMFTGQASYRRSNYLASVVVFSGGFYAPSAAPMDAEPQNLFSAMVVHGGPGDEYGGIINFLESSGYYMDALRDAGRFVVECDHGMGHTIGNEQESIHMFYDDHPWGTLPSPYAGGLPAGFIDECFVP